MYTGPNITTDGLVLYLDAANPKSYPGSGTVWSDLSGNGYTGTLTNGPTFDSGSNGSIGFDGTNDYITFSNAKSLIQGQTNFTLGLTFQSNTNLVLRGLFGTLRYNCGSNLGFVSSFNNLAFYNDYGPISGGTCYPIGFSNYVTPDTWIYAIATYDGSTTRVYGIKNGILSKASGGLKSGPTNIFDYQLEIGRGGFGQYLTGKVANAFIYNKTLSEQEILQNYNATKSRYNL
jgi:hypothetical protein